MRGAGAGGAAGARRTLLAVLLSGLPFSFLSLSLSFFFVVLSGCSSRTLSARGAGPEPGATISSGSSASGTTAEDEEDEPAEGLAARACSVRKGRGEASSPEEEEEARQELAASSSKLAVHPALRVPEKEDSPARRMAGSPWPGHSGREAGAEGEGEEAEDEVVFGANEGDAATFARSVLPLLGASSDEGSGAASCDRATRACPAAQSSSSRASSAKRERKKNGGASRWRWSSCCRRLWREAAAELVRIIAMAAASFESGCRPCSLSNAFLESRARQHGYREMEGRARTGACRDAPQRARLKALPFISSCVEKKTSMQDEKNRRTLIFFPSSQSKRERGSICSAFFRFFFPKGNALS